MRSILVCHSLLSVLSGLRKYCDSEGISIVPFISGDEIGTHLQHDSVEAVVVALRMPGKGGIEVCEQIKQSPAYQNILVFIISDSKSAALEIGANAARCDLFAYLQEGDQRIVTALRWHALPSGRVDEASRADRFNLAVPIQILVGPKIRFGTTLNASRSGMLFLTSDKIQEGAYITLRFLSQQGAEIDVRAEVIRIQSTIAVSGHTTYAVGAKYVYVNQRCQQQLRSLSR